MKAIAWIVAMLLSTASLAQECNPYYNIPKYELSDKKSAGIGYVACFHARGVVAEVGYNNLFIGILVMGDGHHGATYSFLQYELKINRLSVYGGPAYRINHNPSLLIGRAGIDYRLYKKINATLSVLQINNKLNYLHAGIKLTL